MQFRFRKTLLTLHNVVLLIVALLAQYFSYILALIRNDMILIDATNSSLLCYHHNCTHTYTSPHPLPHPPLPFPLPHPPLPFPLPLTSPSISLPGVRQSVYNAVGRSRWREGTLGSSHSVWWLRLGEQQNRLTEKPHLNVLNWAELIWYEVRWREMKWLGMIQRRRMEWDVF